MSHIVFFRPCMSRFTMIDYYLYLVASSKQQISWEETKKLIGILELILSESE